MDFCGPHGLACIAMWGPRRNLLLGRYRLAKNVFSKIESGHVCDVYISPAASKTSVERFCEDSFALNPSELSKHTANTFRVSRDDSRLLTQKLHLIQRSSAHIYEFPGYPERTS